MTNKKARLSLILAVLISCPFIIFLVRNIHQLMQIKHSNQDDYVTSLDQQTFDNALKSGELWIVKFFNPGCGHCRAFAPTYLEFGQQMAHDQFLNVGEISCTEYNDVCASQGVFGVPTVRLYYKGKQQTFSGSRTVDALKQFVEEYIRIWHISVDYEDQEIEYSESEEQDYSESEDTEAVVSLNMQSFVYALYSGELWIVKFFKPGCGYCKAFAPTYLEFGQQMKKHQYLNVGELSCSNYSSICASQGVFGVPTVKLYYNDDEAEFYGERTVKGLKKFVKKYIKIWQINIEDYEDEDEKDNKQIYKIVFIISAGIIVVLANIILIVFIRKRQKRTSSKQNREISNEYAKLPLEPVDNSTNLMPSD